jgi:O-antigen/teichoic acid export membrane protein
MRDEPETPTTFVSDATGSLLEGPQPEAPGPHQDLDRRIIRNSLWVGVGYGGGQVLSMVSMLVLVRLLTPSAFGVVALGMTLLGVLAYLQESGLGSALVHFRDNPRQTAASALLFSIAASAALAAAVALIAPVYAHLVHTPAATDIVRALSIVLLIRGLGVVPGAILERELAFRKRAVSELSASIVLACVSISCAVGGLGAWSLVFGQIAATTTQLIAMWLLVPWRPHLRDASVSTLRGMLRYGRFVSAANLINLFNLSIDNLSIGRLLGTGALGVYALGYRLTEIPNTVIAAIVGKVMFSVYSTLQGDKVAVRHAYLENLRRTLLFGLPVTLGLGIAADPIVPALLGNAWLGAETPVRILAVFSLARLIAGPAGELFKGVGRPHLTVIGALTFLGVAATSLAILVPRYGITGAATAMLLAGLTAGSVSTSILLRVLGLSARELGAVIARPALVALPLAVALLALLPLVADMRPWPALAVLVIVGIVVYGLSVALLGRSLVQPIWSALRGRSTPA